ncbi:MAG TPA: hypothetical protein VGC91_08080 [Pyrinomonadaceae bacterium]|jgi:hypothetical protein
MADTLRQKLVDKVVARMRTILISNGYQTDLGGKVEEWLTHCDEGEGAQLGVCDLNNDPELSEKYALDQTNKLKIQLRVMGAQNPAELRKMIGDCQTAVKKDPRWDGMALQTIPGQDGFMIPSESFQVAGAAIEFTIEYLSNTFDAYE